MFLFVDRFRQWIRRVNIFKSGTLDEEMVEIERCSSWVYIVLFIAILEILSMYTGLGRQTTTVTIDDPSHDTFESLQQKYPFTLHCPCSVTSNQRSGFMRINVTFHQVCSSSFITDEWITATFEANTPFLWPMDARTVASSYAQGLQFLCEASQINVNTEIGNTLSTFVSSPEALSASALAKQIDQMSANGLITLASGRLVDVSTLFSYSLSADMAISAFGTNAGVYVSSQNSMIPSLAFNEYRFPNGSLCYCLPTQTCVAPAAIYSSTASKTRNVLSIDANSTFIKGMKTDCYPYSGLLASTLECYYDASCLQLLVPNSSAFKPLNSTSPSQLTLSSTINDLINVAMTEVFLLNYSAETHYKQCAPRFCIYSYEHRSTLLTIVTTVIGVVSGLNTGLRLLIPFVLGLLRKCWRKCRRLSVPKTAVITPESVPDLNLKQKIVNLGKKVILVNLFDSDSNDAAAIDREIKTTRLYALLLLTIATFLALYVNLFQTIQLDVVDNPSETDFRALQGKYPDTLKCLCSKEKIAYKNIVQTNVTYHQICSSDFVSIPFILQLATFDATSTYQYDFMTTSGAYFIHIALFCQLIEAYVNQAYVDYLNETFGESRLIPADQFQEKINTLTIARVGFIKTYIDHAILDALQYSSKSYGIPTLYNYFDMAITADGGIRTGPSHFFNCSCITNPDTCSTDAAFYAYTPSNGTASLLFKVMGLRLACSSTRSTLLSSFACWYSADCYEQVVSFWRNRTTFFNFIPPLLDASLNKHFNISDTLMDILQEGMIDQLFLTSSYSDFFSECAASNCTYSIKGRQNVIIIITSLISICSGLSVALRLLTPFLFHIAYWSLGLVHGRVDLWQLIRRTPQQLFHLNFFFNRHKSSPTTLHTEQRTTRVYMVIWVSVFATLLLYNLFAEQTNTVKVSQPTEAVFSELYPFHYISLNCPCTSAILSFRSFLNLTVRLHPVCSSPFIEDPWIANVFGDGSWSSLPSNQFRTRGAIWFVVQQSICSSAQRAVDLTIVEFLGNIGFNDKIIPKEQLVSQTSLAVDSAKNWNKNHFRAILSVLRGGIQTNQLINVFFSNWIYLPQHDPNPFNYRFFTAPVSHGSNCSCATSSTCTEPMYVDGSLLPGFVLGCNPIESLFRSTLSCLYNHTCIQRINFGNLSSIDPLELLLLTQHYPNSTVDELALEAFVEEWIMNISYSDFFSACAPSTCTYTISERKRVLDVITIMLGLYGGLTLILRIVVPWLMASLEEAFFFMLRRGNDRVMPFS